MVEVLSNEEVVCEIDAIQEEFFGSLFGVLVSWSWSWVLETESGVSWVSWLFQPRRSRTDGSNCMELRAWREIGRKGRKGRKGGKK
jgi:hypothetical protein